MASVDILPAAIIWIDIGQEYMQQSTKIGLLRIICHLDTFTVSRLLCLDLLISRIFLFTARKTANNTGNTLCTCKEGCDAPETTARKLCFIHVLPP